MIPILYAIKHIPTNNAYVGSTIDAKTRHQTHLRMLNRGNHHCNHLQRAWDKYGASQFEFVTIGTATNVKELREIEQAFLESFFDNGLYNAKCSAIGMASGDSHPAKSADWHMKHLMKNFSAEERKQRYGGSRGKQKISDAYSIAVKKQWADSEQKAKRSLAMRGKREIVECPYCQVKGGGGNMRRYHFDNCKAK